MLLNGFRITKPAWYSKHRLLIWAALVSMISGVIQFGEPLDHAMRIARNAVRSHPPSGQVVIVGIDEHSVQKVSEWPWTARHYAQIIDRLNALGARRIFLMSEFPTYTDSADDRALALALEQSRAEVALPARFVENPGTGSREDFVPAPYYAQRATVANINARYNGLVGVWALPYSVNMQGHYYPSIASKIAGRDGAPGSVFPIDYAIDVAKAPVMNASELLSGNAARSTIAGKDVIVGTTSRNFGQTYPLPGKGQAPAVYVHFLGGETLLKGTPMRLGWAIPLILAMVLAAFIGTIARKPRHYALLAGTMLVLPIVPILLESALIFIDVVPAMLFLLVILGANIWSSFRQKGITTNPISGLPNLNALRQLEARPGDALVAVRILNYAAIRSSLPQEMEGALISQIVQRLSVGLRNAMLYQGDEGLFAWLIERAALHSIGDELEALHALFRSPVVVEGRYLDLSLAFGVDMGGARLISNRLGSALVAADEAGNEGLRWKAYDPARLEDAEWQLSLLGRLDAAIDSGEIWVAYQPKMDIASHRICSAEALARWSHPEKGDISPEDFILAAEQHNRIEKLTAHVLDQALAAIAQFEREGVHFTISVNLSMRLLENKNVISMVRSLLDRHTVDPGKLILEVTESAEMTSARSLEVLAAIRAIGVEISLDDYGTGFSTLDYLKKIPASEIKIDKSFVNTMDRSQSDRIMVSSTVNLAHSLKRRVVAEGVERTETLDALAQVGCDMAQGYLIGRPMPFHDLYAWYRERKLMVA